LRGVRCVGHLDVAGSYRRRKETVGDLDLVAKCRRASSVMDQLATFGETVAVIDVDGQRILD
jgi:DNA polymerase (family 10)